MSSSFRKLLGKQGFSLVEVMIAAGMLGIVSMGVMQMMQNMNKGQKTADLKSTRAWLTYNIDQALKDSRACERTFAGKIAPGMSATPPAPAAIDPTAEPFITTLYNQQGNVVLTSSPVGNANIYGGVGARIQVDTIQVKTTDTCALDTECDASLVVSFTNLGVTIGSAGVDQQKNAYVAEKFALTFPLRFKKWGPTYPGGTPGINDALVDECLSSNTAYINEACLAMGGIMEGAFCKRLSLAAQGVLPAPIISNALDAVTVNPDIHIIQDEFVDRGLVVGTGGGALNPTSGGLGVGLNSTGVGNLDVLNNVTIGGTTTGTGLMTGLASFNLMNNTDIRLYTGPGVGGGSTNSITIFGDLAGAASGIAFRPSNNGDLVMPSKSSDILVSGNILVGSGQTSSGTAVGSGVQIFGSGNQTRYLLPGVSLVSGGNVIISSGAQSIMGIKGGAVSDFAQIRFDNDASMSSLATTDLALVAQDQNTLRVDGGNFFVGSGSSNYRFYQYEPDIADLGPGAGSGGTVSSLWSGGYSQVATKAWVTHLLGTTIDYKDWERLMETVVEAVLGTSYEAGFLNVMARYVCATMKKYKGYTTDAGESNPASFSWSAASNNCTFFDQFDAVPIQNCDALDGTGNDMFLYRIDSGTAYCRKLPGGVTNAPPLVSYTGAGGNIATSQLCVLLMTNRSGETHCARKQLFYTSGSNCGGCPGSPCGNNSCGSGWNRIVNCQADCLADWNGSKVTASITSIDGQAAQNWQGYSCPSGTDDLSYVYTTCDRQSGSFGTD